MSRMNFRWWLGFRFLGKRKYRAVLIKEVVLTELKNKFSRAAVWIHPDCRAVTVPAKASLHSHANEPQLEIGPPPRVREELILRSPFSVWPVY